MLVNIPWMEHVIWDLFVFSNTKIINIDGPMDVSKIRSSPQQLGFGLIRDWRYILRYPRSIWIWFQLFRVIFISTYKSADILGIMVESGHQTWEYWWFYHSAEKSPIFFSTWNGNSLDPSHFVPPIVFFEALKQWARPPMVVRLWPEHPMCRLGQKHLVDGQDAGVPHNCFCLIFGYPLLIEQSSGKLPIY